LQAWAAVNRTGAIRWRELARKTGNGVEVALLWDAMLNRVKVVVSDSECCHHVDLELDGASALSAFHDPFVDATVRLSAEGPTDEFGGFSPSLEQIRSDEGANS
jgi:hypothetical protein